MCVHTTWRCGDPVKCRFNFLVQQHIKIVGYETTMQGPRLMLSRGQPSWNHTHILGTWLGLYSCCVIYWHSKLLWSNLIDYTTYACGPGDTNHWLHLPVFVFGKLKCIPLPNLCVRHSLKYEHSHTTGAGTRGRVPKDLLPLHSTNLQNPWEYSHGSGNEAPHDRSKREKIQSWHREFVILK
jgi:hypothetical protein